MKIFLDESQCKEKLAPFTLTRHTADIRIGILTIREKWEMLLSKQNSTLITDSDLNALVINQILFLLRMIIMIFLHQQATRQTQKTIRILNQ
jgi:hypothetical protein